MRYRTRLEVNWSEAAPITAALVVAVAIAGSVLLPASAEAASSKLRAARYLVAAQNRDGGWGGAGKLPSNLECTGIAVDALSGFPDAGEQVLQGAVFIGKKTKIFDTGKQSFIVKFTIIDYVKCIVAE